MGLRDIESKLPPGFRFHPSDEELVCYYLQKKVANERISPGTMVEVDLHAREPWELPEVAKLSADEWYFFSFRDRKYATGSRTNRATKSGYWKATGKDRMVHEPMNRAMVGTRKTLVFYRGRAPNGQKTDWIMHEFRLGTPHSPPREDWVLCRVFQKRKGEAEQGNQSTASTTGIGPSSPTSIGSPPPEAPTMAEGKFDHQVLVSSPINELMHEDFGNNNCNSSNALLDFSMLQNNFSQFPLDLVEVNTSTHVANYAMMELGLEYGDGGMERLATAGEDLKLSGGSYYMDGLYF